MATNNFTPNKTQFEEDCEDNPQTHDDSEDIGNPCADLDDEAFLNYMSQFDRLTEDQKWQLLEHLFPVTSQDESDNT